VPLGEAVAGRRSTSPPGPAALTRAELSTVLALAYGATAVPGDPRGHRRPVPSGGAMYPLDVYVGLSDEGIYHYDPFRHVLEELRGPSAWSDLVAAGPAPEVVAHASVVLLLVACFARQSAKYGPRAYRFCYLEAGHVGQNVALTASALGLGCLPFGSLHDREVERLLDLDGVHESLVHAVLLGR
jgi:SagB-type dehydrogenase family enzyme